MKGVKNKRCILCIVVPKKKKILVSRLRAIAVLLPIFIARAVAFFSCPLEKFAL